MARVWIEDRSGQRDYEHAVAKAKAAKRTPPGRFRVRWYDPSGAEKMRTVGRRSDDEAVKAEIESRLRDGSYRDPSAGRVHLAEVAETWYATQTHLKRLTLHEYRRHLDLYVLPYWGATPLNAIRHDEVALWVASLTREPGRAGSPLGASQARKIYRVLSLVLGWAVKSQRIAVNPAAGVSLPRLTPNEHVYLTELQLETLAEKAGPYRSLVLLLGYTGLRWGEAAALTIGRLDLDNRRARVVQNYTEVNGVLQLDTPKSHAKRTVAFPGFLADELRPHAAERRTSDLLFAAPGGQPLRYHNWRRDFFDPAVKAAWLDELGVTPHKLRHTAASLAIASGADVKVVQTMMGHATATMTLDTYGHLFPDRLDEITSRMDKRRAKALKAAGKLPKQKDKSKNKKKRNTTPPEADEPRQGQETQESDDQRKDRS